MEARAGRWTETGRLEYLICVLLLTMSLMLISGILLKWLLVRVAMSRKLRECMFEPMFEVWGCTHGPCVWYRTIWECSYVPAHLRVSLMFQPCMGSAGGDEV